MTKSFKQTFIRRILKVFTAKIVVVKTKFRKFE